jgi:hypothetical protein
MTSAKCQMSNLYSKGEIHETLQIYKSLTKRQIQCFNNDGGHGFGFATPYRALPSFVNDPLRNREEAANHSQLESLLEMFTTYVNTVGTIFGEFYLKERIVIDMFVSQPKSASFSSHSEFAARGAAEA